MGMFTQWVKFEQARHIDFRLSSVAHVFMEVSQLFQRSGDLQLQALSLKEEPLVKGRAIRAGETIQQRTTHEIDSAAQPASAILRLPWMRVGTAASIRF